VNKVTLVSLGYPLSVFQSKLYSHKKKGQKEKRGGKKEEEKERKEGVWREKKERGRRMVLGGSEECAY